MKATVKAILIFLISGSSSTGAGEAELQHIYILAIKVNLRNFSLNSTETFLSDQQFILMLLFDR